MKTRRNGLFAGLAAMAALAVGVASFAPSAVARSAEESMAKVGQKAPDFTLKDTNGEDHSLSAYTGSGKIVVLEWFNSGCPFVVRHHQQNRTMGDLAEKYAGKVQWLAINSGAPGMQGYGKDAEAIKKWHINYPVLIDADGQVGRMYGAKTTPHMFIIDAKGTLVYAGAIDNDREGKLSPGERVNYVQKALDEVLAGKQVSEPETRSYGCNVKYGS